MSDVPELISTAKRLSGDDAIHAAGIFALKDQYLKLGLWGIVGGGVGGAAGEQLGAVASSTGAAVGGTVGDAVGTVSFQNKERMNEAQKQGFE